jgi:hypothetical protein
MNQGKDRETEVKDWVDHKIGSGEAIVHPAGSHMVGRKTTFQQRLNNVAGIGELEGFANRRKFDPTLARWTDDERAAIILRKTEMMNVKRKRK